MSLYMLGASSHAASNFFYLFLGIPTLAYLVRNPKELLSAIYDCKWLYLFFLSAIFAELFSLYGEWGKTLKYVCYLTLLIFVLKIVSSNEILLKRVFLLFSALSVLIGMLVVFEWLAAYFNSGEYVRVILFGVSPTYISMMFLLGMSVATIFLIEEKISDKPIIIKFPIIILLLGFSIIVIAFLQSRSALLSLTVFIFVYGLLKLGLWRVIGLIAVFLIILFLSGAYEFFLERGTSYRTEIWVDGWQHYKSECSILFGCGSQDPHVFSNQFQNPHSGYLGTLLDYGLAGFVALSAFLIQYIIWAVKNNSGWFFISIGGWTAAIASSSGFIDSPEPQWIYLWIPTILTILYSSKGKKIRLN